MDKEIEKIASKKEEIERKQLREEYLKQFKAGFRQQLDGVKVVDEKGNDVTPNRKGEA